MATAAPSSRSPHRMVRRSLGALVLLLILVVVVDRVAETVVSRRLAAQIQVSQSLTSRPAVTIHGFPFLLQALRGAYGDVSVHARSPLARQGITVDHLTMRLRNAQVSLEDALHGTVSGVRIGRGVGTGVIPYASINDALTQHGGTAGQLVTVAGAGRDQARLTGPLGISLTVTAVVHNGHLTIVPDPSQVRDLPGTLQGVVASLARTAIPLPALPLGLSLTSGTFEPDGLHVAASGRHINPSARS